jgi:ribosomal protein S30
MPYQILKIGNHYKIKNLKSGKTGKLKYALRKNAEVQVKNRLKYEKFIKRRSGVSPA